MTTTVALSPNTDTIAKYGASKPVENLTMAYGTGGYNYHIIDDTSADAFYTYCETDTAAFYIIDSESSNNVLVEVIKGNIDEILKLVAAEIEHFDEEVVIL